MPTVVITKKATLPAAEAFQKVKSILTDDKDLKKLDPGYKCTFNESAMTGQASGKMFKATMNVKGQSSGSEVEIVVDLPLAFALAKGLVKKTLEKKLNDSLA